MQVRPRGRPKSEPEMSLTPFPQPSPTSLRRTGEKSSGYAWVTESSFPHRLPGQRKNGLLHRIQQKRRMRRRHGAKAGARVYTQSTPLGAAGIMCLPCCATMASHLLTHEDFKPSSIAHRTRIRPPLNLVARSRPRFDEHRDARRLLRQVRSLLYAHHRVLE